MSTSREARVVPEATWLTEPEERAWRGYLRMRALLDLRIARDLARCSGLSDADYHVLAVLSETERHRLRLMDLVHRTLWSKSRLVHHLGRMERRGLVMRERRAGNARATDVVLTAHGLETITAAAPDHVGSVRRHFVDLLTTEQLGALGDLAETVVGHLRALPDNEDPSASDGPSR